MIVNILSVVCNWMLLTSAQIELGDNGLLESATTAHLANSEMTSESDELRLYHHLMKHYDRDVRPMKNISHPVVIRLGITLTQIFDLEWFDEYLTWNPGNYGDIKSIRVPCERIWLPDVVLYNNADDYTQGFMNSKAMVSHDGNVFWPPPTKLRSKCPVDVTYFPFDHQVCILKLGSWIYDGFQVDVTNRSTEVDMSNYVPNGEWELMETKIKRNVVYYPCCPEPFPDVTITIVIRRRTLYYISNVVLPCMMMSALTLLVFRLPPDAGEKIALGFTVLLAFSVFMLTVAEKMPETSTSVPLIGMYLTAVMAITTVSIMMTVMVLNFHYRGPSKRPAPQWLKSIILGRLGTFFCSDIFDPKDTSISCRRRQVAASIANRQQPVSIMDSTLSSRENRASGYCCAPNHAVDTRQQKTACITVSCNAQQLAPPNCSYHHEILRILRSMMDREEQELQRMEVINEWRQMAVVVDRLLFWVFLMAILVCSVLFLVVLPSHRMDMVRLHDGGDAEPPL